MERDAEKRRSHPFAKTGRKGWGHLGFGGAGRARASARTLQPFEFAEEHSESHVWRAEARGEKRDGGLDSAGLKPWPFRTIRRSCFSAAVLAAAAFFVLLAISPCAISQSDSAATLHVNVKLVNVFVNVTDRNGAIVGGLTRDDFRVFEDNRPQTISVFERQSEMPLNLTLAIDTSGSVYKDRSVEQSAAKHFVHALLRPQDKMNLIEFATDVQELTPFTNKVNLIDHGLDRLRGGPSTALYDAIFLGSKKLGPLDGRKVLVIVSDGDDTAEDISYADALEQALRNEVMIYSLIDVPIEASAGRDLRGEHALITLAEQTGGKSFYVSEGGLDKAFARVSDDLRTQYLLGYYPKNQVPGRNFHRVTVTVPRAAASDFNIRNRAGYYADSPIGSD
jgi:Ca-activated chloride channel homolog